MKKTLLILITILLFVTGCVEPSKEYFPEGGEQVAITQKNEVFVFINFSVNPIVNEVKCFGEYDYFSYEDTFFELSDDRTIVEKVTDSTIYRFSMPLFRVVYGNFENPLLLENLNNLTNETGELHFNCRTKFLSPNDGVYAHIWDEGYEEIKEVNLHERIEFNCETDYPRSNNGQIEYYCGYRDHPYDQQLSEFVYELPSKIISEVIS